MTPTEYQKAVQLYWKDKQPKRYREAKKAGTLDKETLEIAEQMFEQELILTDQLRDKNQGQAGMIAREIVMHNFLPS